MFGLNCSISSSFGWYLFTTQFYCPTCICAHYLSHCFRNKHKIERTDDPFSRRCFSSLRKQILGADALTARATYLNDELIQSKRGNSTWLLPPFYLRGTRILRKSSDEAGVTNQHGFASFALLYELVWPEQKALFFNCCGCYLPYHVRELRKR